MGVFIVLILIDFFIWWRMLSDLRHRPVMARATAIAVLSVLTVFLLMLIFRIITYKGIFDEPVNVFRFLEFGSVAGVLIIIGILYVLISLCTLILRRYFHRSLSGIIWTNLAVAGLIILLFTDGHFRQRFDLRITRKEVRIPELDHRLDGLKIVMISDMHLASFYGHYNKLSIMMDSINRLDPDVLINGGDFISYGWREFGNCDTILDNANASLGAFAVSGNHDDGSYYPDFNPEIGSICEKMLKEKIESSGYVLLSDSSATISYNGLPVTIAGVVSHGHHLDVSYGDFGKALAKADSSALTVLLLHNPVGWDSVLTRRSAPALTLSGHTHGMQVGFPVPGGYISPASLIHKYWRGLYEKEGRYLFVSTGAGSMGMSVRIFMPPEIVLLTIKVK